MKITLKNFRCWENNTFEIPDNQLTLISGPSGNGKSTILMAIYFALYGSSNHKYLVSHNKQSCEVIMEYPSTPQEFDGGAVARHASGVELGASFRIKRTKRPNILNVWVNGRLFEDEEAQVIIDRNFGQSSIFSNFLDMSVSDKAHFLEKIINSTYNINTLKDTLKKDILNVNKELATIDGQLSTADELCKIVTKPDKVGKPQPPPVKSIDPEEMSIVEVSEAIQTALSDQRATFGLLQQKLALQSNGAITPAVNASTFEELESEMKKTESEMSTVCIAEKKCVAQEECAKIAFASLAQQQKELAETESDANVQILDIETRLRQTNEQLETKLNLLPIYKIQQARIRYNKILEKEMKIWKKNISNLENSLNFQTLPQTTEDSLSESLYKYREATKFMKSTNKKELCLQIAALKRGFFKNLNCPKCSSFLTLDINTHKFVESKDLDPLLKVQEFDHKPDDASQLTSGGLRDGFAAKLQEIRRLETLVDKCISAQNIIDTMDIDDIYKKYNQLRVKLDEICEFKPSETLQELKLALLPSNKPDDLLISDPTQEIDTLKDVKRDLEAVLKDAKTRLRQRTSLEIVIAQNQEHIRAYDSGEHARLTERVNQLSNKIARLRDARHAAISARKIAIAIDTLDSKIAMIGFEECKLLELNTKLDNLNRVKKYENDLGLYLEFIKNLKKYKKAKQTLLDLRLLQSSKMDHYHKLLVFRKHVIDAETESLNSIVLSVNAHLQMFLDDFFSEDCGEPIQVYLEAINDKKPQINTIINYKGNLVDFKSLSAGEGARVKLAFDLTFKEILNEHIIMLDECTANLDQDLTTKVCKKIKDVFPSKTILLVAHQVVSGLFDNNIKV
jgi:DNA repair exonuclease SbcCD ATPase subunit